MAEPAKPKRVRIATVSLAGCFGCHMSLLDVDERLLELAKVADLDRSPFTDVKTSGACDIGLVEGGVCNEENVHVLKEFREHCRVLVAIGACAINGGIPAIRNRFTLAECLEESYVKGIGIESARVPDDPEIPLLLDKVYPIHEVVKIDYSIPGCPPEADALWSVLTDLIAGRQPALPQELVRYD